MNSKKWADIKDFEGYYIASDDGDIMGLDRIVKHGSGCDMFRKGKLMAKSLDGMGYHVVTLSKEGKCHTPKVHRLIASAFIRNIDNKPEVNHKNGIKTDNMVSNLEWATPSENVIHAHKTGLVNIKIGINHSLYGKRSEEVKKTRIILNIETGIYYYGLNAAALHNNVPRAHLSDKLNGIRKNNTSLIYA
jgi:HNH endonuclease/NUMOD4 motif-containing protein